MKFLTVILFGLMLIGCSPYYHWSIINIRTGQYIQTFYDQSSIEAKFRCESYLKENFKEDSNKFRCIYEGSDGNPIH